jgi:hypothetical protein
MIEDHLNAPVHNDLFILDAPNPEKAVIQDSRLSPMDIPNTTTIYRYDFQVVEGPGTQILSLVFPCPELYIYVSQTMWPTTPKSPSCPKQVPHSSSPMDWSLNITKLKSQISPWYKLTFENPCMDQKITINFRQNHAIAAARPLSRPVAFEPSSYAALSKSYTFSDSTDLIKLCIPTVSPLWGSSEKA